MHLCNADHTGGCLVVCVCMNRCSTLLYCHRRLAIISSDLVLDLSFMGNRNVKTEQWIRSFVLFLQDVAVQMKLVVWSFFFGGNNSVNVIHRSNAFVKISPAEH